MMYVFAVECITLVSPYIVPRMWSTGSKDEPGQRFGTVITENPTSQPQIPPNDIPRMHPLSRNEKQRKHHQTIPTDPACTLFPSPRSKDPSMKIPRDPGLSRPLAKGSV